MVDKVNKSDAEWKEELTPEQYRITRKKGTERAFTGEYWNTHDAGTYRCACCGSFARSAWSFCSAATFEAKNCLSCSASRRPRSAL